MRVYASAGGSWFLISPISKPSVMHGVRAMPLRYTRTTRKLAAMRLVGRGVSPGVLQASDRG